MVRQGREPEVGDYLVPGRFAGSCLSMRAFVVALERAAAEAGLQGVSTHTYRRSSSTAANGEWHSSGGFVQLEWPQKFEFAPAMLSGEQGTTGGCCCIRLTY